VFFLKDKANHFQRMVDFFFSIITDPEMGLGHAFFYFVDFDQKFNITPFFNTKGWTDLYFSKTKNEILIKEPIWDGNERLDDPHRQKFNKYIWNNYNFVKEELGSTRFKYDTKTEETPEVVLSGLLKKEPQFNKVIDTSNLIYRL